MQMKKTHYLRSYFGIFALQNKINAKQRRVRIKQNINSLTQ